MTVATAWSGRRGSVLLGPTQHRVARYLADRTRGGWVTFRTADLAEACRLERSEAYRITARLRDLGLFGIANDRGGTRGGRRYWRTSELTEPNALDARRHREAWARIRAWARAKVDRLAVRIIRAQRSTPAHGQAVVLTAAPVSSRRSPAQLSFADAMQRYGLHESIRTGGRAT